MGSEWRQVPLRGIEYSVGFLGGMMNTGAVRRVQSLGPVLIASTNTDFAAAIGQMVIESGFTPAFPARFEGPWLSVTRTQPRVVICDHDAPVERIHRLIAEVSSRRVPIMMVHTAERSATSAEFASVERVTWLRLPASPTAFRGILRDLVPAISARGRARAAADFIFFHPVDAVPSASVA
jgi:hypothetical protein